MDLVRRAKEIASILSALTNITQSSGGSGSGSGSGDLSTATIKFINSGGSGTGYTVTVAEIIDESIPPESNTPICFSSAGIWSRYFLTFEISKSLMFMS